MGCGGGCSNINGELAYYCWLVKVDFANAIFGEFYLIVLHHKSIDNYTRIHVNLYKIYNY